MLLRGGSSAGGGPAPPERRSHLHSYGDKCQRIQQHYTTHTLPFGNASAIYATDVFTAAWPHADSDSAADQTTTHLHANVHAAADHYHHYHNPANSNNHRCADVHTCAADLYPAAVTDSTAHEYPAAIADSAAVANATADKYTGTNQYTGTNPDTAAYQYFNTANVDRNAIPHADSLARPYSDSADPL